MNEEKLKIFLSQTLKIDGRETFLELFLEKGKELLKAGNYSNASIMFKNALKKDPENSEAKNLLEEVEKKLSKSELPLKKLVLIFLQRYFPQEIKSFTVYWETLSQNQAFMKGDTTLANAAGLRFHDKSKDTCFTIIEIIVHLVNNRVLEKRDLKETDLRNWMSDEIEDITKNRKIKENIIEYFINLSREK